VQAIDPVELPEDVESLRHLALTQRTEIAQRDTLIAQRDAEIAQLAAYVRLLKHQRFGTRSEKLDPHAQPPLFNEAELESERAERAEAKRRAVPVAAHTRTPRGRKPLPDWIPRVEIVHDLAASQKTCPHDGAALARIGEETCEQLEIVPAELRVVRHVRPKYACPRCHEGVHTAALPPQPIPKSLASPALLAHVAVSKYADALPLYRQEAMLARLGLELPRATLADWMVKVGALVVPLINLLREDLLATGFVQCDETPFQVLKGTGKLATADSYLWVLRGGARDRPLLLYHYAPSRGGAVVRELLAGYQGVLQTDGYVGYDDVGRQPGIVHVGCWAHARRKFDEALKSLPAKERTANRANEPLALAALRQIGTLYAIERELADTTPEERLRVRQAHTRPLLEALRAWLDAALPRIAPQTLTGKALAYLDTQWPKLVRILVDGRVPLDTNLVENAIRPFVLGRKNWLFADTARGAEASANLYSLVESAKANGLDPTAYLRHVFTHLPAATTLAEIEPLLPHRVERDKLGQKR
jgi:transposase